MTNYRKYDADKMIRMVFGHLSLYSVLKGYSVTTNLEEMVTDKTLTITDRINGITHTITVIDDEFVHIGDKHIRFKLYPYNSKIGNWRKEAEQAFDALNFLSKEETEELNNL